MRLLIDVTLLGLGIVAGRLSVGWWRVRPRRGDGSDRLRTAEQADEYTTELHTASAAEDREWQAAARRGEPWLPCSPARPCGGAHCGQCRPALGSAAQVQARAVSTQLIPLPQFDDETLGDAT